MFHENFAEVHGGAIFTRYGIFSYCQFQNNSAEVAGGAIYFLIQDPFHSLCHIAVHNRFEYNKAGSGGAIYYNCTFEDTKCYVYIDGKLHILGNKAANGGAIYAQNIVFTLVSNTTTVSDLFYTNYAFNIESTNFVTLTFSNNYATSSGGAMYTVNSSLILSQKAVMTLANNAAEDEGGGLYLNNSDITT